MGNNAQGQIGRRRAVTSRIHMGSCWGLEHRWGIEMVSIRGIAELHVSPNFLSLSNLVEPCRILQVSYRSCVDFSFALCRSIVFSSYMCWSTMRTALCLGEPDLRVVHLRLFLCVEYHEAPGNDGVGFAFLHVPVK